MKQRLKRKTFLGPVLWILSIQYFIIQAFVAMAWIVPYNFSKDAISDLGNTACGIYASRYVCSPWHTLMNISFILLGITMVGGAALIYEAYHKSHIPSLVGFSCMILAGIGIILVGLFPENINTVVHALGAFLVFFIGNLGIVLLGPHLKINNKLKIFSYLTGSISLLAALLLVNGAYLGLGFGGMERLTAYPQTIWLIIIGLYYLIKYEYSKN